MTLFHYTTVEGILGILKEGYIRTYSTYKGYTKEYLSMTLNSNIHNISRDERYTKSAVRLELDFKENYEITLQKVQYTLDFFRDDEELSAYLLTDADNLMDLLYYEPTEEYMIDEINSLRVECEVVAHDYIPLKFIKSIRVYNNNITVTEQQQIITAIRERNLNYGVMK